VAFVEYTAALSLAALTVVAVALWRASFRPWLGWWWLTLGFLSLALGPFVIVAGTNTMIPTPWALLRYVPLVSAVRTPTRFAIVVALGVAMLLAGAVAAIGERWPHRRRTIGWTVLLLVACELFPAPRTLYSGEYSPLSHIIAADPGAVRVLNLPFGVRDGVSSAGNFSARAQFEQTRHHKPLIGGYLSRVSSRRLSTMTEEHPLIASLIRLSEGHELSAAEARQFVEGGPAFVERTNIGYVLIDTRHITPRAAALAVEAFRLEAIAVDGSVTLYRTGPEIIVDAR
jgi:hypothetical protein